MNKKRIILAGIIILIINGIYAQKTVPTIKVMDIEKVTTLVQSASTSSSSSCNSPDFPVIKGGSRKDINFNDLSWISVLHGIPSKEGKVYIPVELTLRNGETEMVDMIRNIRITGKTDKGEFSIQVKDISSVQVLYGPE